MTATTSPDGQHLVIRDKRGAHLTVESWPGGLTQVWVAPSDSTDGPGVSLTAADRRRLVAHLLGEHRVAGLAAHLRRQASEEEAVADRLDPDDPAREVAFADAAVLRQVADEISGEQA